LQKVLNEVNLFDNFQVKKRTIEKIFQLYIELYNNLECSVFDDCLIIYQFQLNYDVVT